MNRQLNVNIGKNELKNKIIETGHDLRMISSIIDVKESTIKSWMRTGKISRIGLYEINRLIRLSKFNTPIITKLDSTAGLSGDYKVKYRGNEFEINVIHFNKIKYDEDRIDKNGNRVQYNAFLTLKNIYWVRPDKYVNSNEITNILYIKNNNLLEALKSKEIYSVSPLNAADHYFITKRLVQNFMEHLKDIGELKYKFNKEGGVK